MWTVIDTFRCDSELLRDLTSLPQEEGLMALLDPDQVRAPFEAVVRVTVAKPDGSSATLDVAQVSVGHGGVVGLFFRGIEKKDIPRGSIIHVAE